MIDHSDFLNFARDTALAPFAETLATTSSASLSPSRWGDLPQWLEALERIPPRITSDWEFSRGVCIGNPGELPPAQQQEIRAALEALIPWRKGPFQVFDIELDTEWRSDWKWERVLPHIAPLENRMVLDVGCGNGYHCLRMLGEKAKLVLGIDPSPRFVVQFYMLKKLLQQKLPVDVLTLALEQLPANMQAFDTTFSMGVFYHRRSPMDHLRELMETLKPGGELVLETLVIEGELGEVLVPEGRYAMMNNVWFLPSCSTLISWLRKTGWQDVRCVDLNRTTCEEQRATEWMRFHSLCNFLDPRNPELTVEGHPAPRRAVFVARKP